MGLFKKRSRSGDPAGPSWPPLMRAADVNDLWQEGPWKVAVARQLVDGSYDWLPLNEVCTSAEDDPFLPEWPNLVVVAMPWAGVGGAPIPSGAVRHDPMPRRWGGYPLTTAIVDEAEPRHRVRKRRRFLGWVFG